MHGAGRYLVTEPSPSRSPCSGAALPRIRGARIHRARGRSELRKRRTLVGAFIATAAAVATAAALGNAITGPEQLAVAVRRPAKPGVVTKAILTVGDSVGGYRMVGIPDGLGAFDNGDGTFTVLMNHELRRAPGHRPRARRERRVRLEVDDRQGRRSRSLHGEDLIQHVATWTAAGTTRAGDGSRSTGSARPTCRRRRRSGTRRPAWATTAGCSWTARSRAHEGRAFAHALDGTSWELPRSASSRWENCVANPSTGDTTVVVGHRRLDAGPGLRLRRRRRRRPAIAAERAGLTNGTLYGIKVTGCRDRARGHAASRPGRRSSSSPSATASGTTGAQLQTASNAAGVTRVQPPGGRRRGTRTNPNVFYFVTTARSTRRAGSGG